MEKTIEYMRTAVLAYCQEACPIVDSEYVMSPGTKLVHRMLKGDWTQWELQCWNGGTCQWERAFCASPYMGDDDPHFGYLYKIFGLDKRDALEAERAFWTASTDALTKSLEAEKVKNANLQQQLDTEKEKSKRWESRAWKILEIVRRRETEQRPKTAAVLRTLREVSEKNEQLVTALEGIKKPWYIFKLGKRASLKSTLEQYKTRCMAIHDIASRAIEAYKEGKKDEN